MPLRFYLLRTSINQKFLSLKVNRLFNTFNLLALIVDTPLTISLFRVCFHMLNILITLTCGGSCVRLYKFVNSFLILILKFIRNSNLGLKIKG